MKLCVCKLDDTLSQNAKDGGFRKIKLKNKIKSKTFTKKMKAGLDVQDTSGHRPGLVLLI